MTLNGGYFTKDVLNLSVLTCVTEKVRSLCFIPNQEQKKINIVNSTLNYLKNVGNQTRLPRSRWSRSTLTSIV